MDDWKERTRLLLGEEGLSRLERARVAVLGLGGVGGAAAEALCRAGVGELLLIDGDSVDDTNRNRQLLATAETVGLRKTEAAARRLRAILPGARLTLEDRFFTPQDHAFLFDWKPEYILDAIDMVTAKLFLAEQAAARGVPLLCCLGTGNRLDPTALRLGDLAQTAGSGCPLARVMRRELRRRGIAHLPVLYSVEEPARAVCDGGPGRHAPGSVSFVPPAAGYAMASRCVRDLLGR